MTLADAEKLVKLVSEGGSFFVLVAILGGLVYVAWRTVPSYVAFLKGLTEGMHALAARLDKGDAARDAGRDAILIAIKTSESRGLDRVEAAKREILDRIELLEERLRHDSDEEGGNRPPRRSGR